MSLFWIYVSVLAAASQLVSGYSGYLEVQKNFLKPNSERSNQVNKAVWVRHSDRDQPSGQPNDFIFRTISQESEQPNDDDISNFLPKLILRDRRSTEDIHIRNKKSVRKPCKEENCKPTSSDEESILLSKTKIISKLKPSSLINDYPYEVSVLLGNHIDSDNNTSNSTRNKSIKKIVENDLNKSLNDLNGFLEETNIEADLNQKLNNTDKTDTNATASLPNSKRYIASDYSSDISNNIQVIPPLNKTSLRYEAYKAQDMVNNQKVFWKSNIVPPRPPLYQYKTSDSQKSSSSESQGSRTVTEQSLMKLLSMLTKTFKKILKQHDDIKTIHHKLTKINDNFSENLTHIFIKFDKFESQYQKLSEYHKQLQELEGKLVDTEKRLDQKEADLSSKMLQFLNQNKKFIVQQKQFFGIQKIILNQNDKINIKQNLIAKTQSEISHRQTNFAKLLKKIKQLHFEKNSEKHTKLSQAIPRPKSDYATRQETTTIPSTSTDTVKINLFSLMATNPPKLNQDNEILKDMSQDNVDDLVYKYYFNNTFIDTVMKNGFMANVYPDSHATGKIKKRTKSKRTDKEIESKNVAETTTILLPVNSFFFNFSDFFQPLKPRHRRWLNHKRNKKQMAVKKIKNNMIHGYKEYFFKAAPKEKFFTKDTRVTPPTSVDTTTTKDESNPAPEETITEASESTLDAVETTYATVDTSPAEEITPFVEERTFAALETIPTYVETTPQTIIKTKEANDPFVAMAANFCNQIGENKDDQTLMWCVEKTLRRLRVIDNKNIIKPDDDYIISPTSYKNPTTIPTFTTIPVDADLNENIIFIDNQDVEQDFIGSKPRETVTRQVVPSATDVTALFFPDNDELEEYAKYYDLSKADDEGNIYYDKSLHTSKMDLDSDETGGASDVLPGMGSDSREQNEIPVYDRRLNKDALVQRWNNKLYRHLKKKKLMYSRV